MSDNETPAADPGETGYTGYWRGAHEAGVPPVAWEEIPPENQESWRAAAADVLAKHGPAGLAAATAEIRRVRDALSAYAAGWTVTAAGMEAKRAVLEDGPEREVLAAQAAMLRSHASLIRVLAPVLLDMDAPPLAEPYEAELIPERIDRAAPGTAAGGTL